MDLSVLLLTLNEEKNVGPIIARAVEELSTLRIVYEIIVVDGGSDDDTVRIARAAGVRVELQREKGYAAALKEGVVLAQGQWIITLDVDGSHPPALISALWAKRYTAECAVASRFVPGGSSEAPFLRRVLSKVLSIVYPRILALPVRDVSSGYRMYRRDIIADLPLVSRNFAVLLEILIHLVAEGRRVCEVPLVYRVRESGSSKARIWRFGLSYLHVLKRMWSVRNSAAAADYDSRAFDSAIPTQRYRQRRRYAILQEFVGKSPGLVVDVGCGSSRTIQSMPEAVAADFWLPKLRYLGRTNPLRCRLTILRLPFKDAAFDTAVCSQVIEHVPYDERIFTELSRVLKAGGRLIIGTPDYGRMWWPVIEFFYQKLLPNAYADQRITHYTRAKLCVILARHGFEVLEEKYICGGELIVLAKKRGAAEAIPPHQAH